MEMPASSSCFNSSSESVPARARLPIMPKENRAPSSSVKATTSTGRTVSTPRSSIVCATSMPASTPSGPSKFPPPTTESTCEPTRTAGASGSFPSRRPNRLPVASSLTNRPASSIKEATRSLAARSSSVNESRVTPPDSCLPTSARSESLRHSRSTSTTLALPPGFRAATSRHCERAEQEFRCETFGRDAVASRHVAGREERVQDGRLRRLGRRVEEWRHVLVRDHLYRQGSGWVEYSGGRDARVARGEGEEDISAPVV